MFPYILQFIDTSVHKGLGRRWIDTNGLGYRWMLSFYDISRTSGGC